MTDLFHNLSMFEGVPAVAFPAASAYDPTSAPRGTWPTEHGSPAQTSTAGEPLAADRWRRVWEAALGEVDVPRSILVGADTVVVNGDQMRGLWRTSGESIGTIRRLDGSAFLDATGERLLCDEPGSGLSTYTLHDARRHARLMTVFPTDHVTRAIVEGPGVLVVLTIRDFPLGPPPEAVIEALRVRDYASKSDVGILRGIERLGGIIRTDDGVVRMAAARTGPVLAARGGIRWCDWQLRSLQEALGPRNPIAMSADATGRALLVFERDGVARFSIVPPAAPAICDVELPFGVAMPVPPPIITTTGSIVLTPPGLLLVLSPDGRVAVQEVRASRAPAAMSKNGILLVASEDLLALTPDGTRHSLWRPPSPIVATPVLAGGRLYVATSDTLYALQAN